MKFEDEGLLVNIKKLGEKGAIVHFLTKNHGLHAGVIKQYHDKKNQNIWQIGNFFKLIWQARLNEHLGTFSTELLNSIPTRIILNKERLIMLGSLCTILYLCLPERLPEKHIYDLTINFIENLKNCSIQECIRNYVYYELELLAELGFALDLEKCAVTESQKELIYVSPKTGRAVSKQAGEAYKDKLLTLTNFIKQPNYNSDNLVSFEDILLGLKLTGYFINKNILSIKNSNLPFQREYLIKILEKK